MLVEKLPTLITEASRSDPAVAYEAGVEKGRGGREKGRGDWGEKRGNTSPKNPFLFISAAEDQLQEMESMVYHATDLSD